MLWRKTCQVIPVQDNDYGAIHVIIERNQKHSCLLDAMLNYKPEEDEDSEGVQDKIQDKLHDKLHDKFPDLSDKSITKMPSKEGI